MTKHHFNIALLLIGLALAYLFKSWWIFAFVLVVFHAFLFIGIFNLKFNYFIKSENTFLKEKVLLTFDDGPEETTLSILEILKKHHISAIFFLIGNRMEKSPEIVERIISEGHFIGNHTYSHSNGTAFLPTSKLTEEIKKCQQLIDKYQKDNLKIFRPPVGITNPNFGRALKKTGLKSIGWSLRSLDTRRSSADLKNFVLSNIKNSEIVLFHDTIQVTTESLEDIIIESRNRGINFANQSDIKNWNNA